MTDRSEAVILRCYSRARGWLSRHRWEVVPGTMSTPEHPYTERRCVRCGEYESEIR